MRMVNICATGCVCMRTAEKVQFPRSQAKSCRPRIAALNPQSLANNCNYYFMTTCLLRRAVVCPSLLVWHSHGRGFASKKEPGRKVCCVPRQLFIQLGSGFALSCPELCSTHTLTMCTKPQFAIIMQAEWVETFSITVQNFITIHDGVIKIGARSGPKAALLSRLRTRHGGWSRAEFAAATAAQISPMSFRARTPSGNCSSAAFLPSAGRQWGFSLRERIYINIYSAAAGIFAVTRFAPPVGFSALLFG